MRLSRYGIVLETMAADHLEMVRLWRNQGYIREKMQFRHLLSRTDQQQWFNTLDANTNLYWIISHSDYPIGLVHIKDIDHGKGQGEAGVFIGEPSFLRMPQAMLAILFMMELAFYAFGLSRLKAKIHSDNRKAIRFNRDLGYRLEPGQSLGFQYYSVTKREFYAATEVLRSKSVKMYGGMTGMGALSPSSVWDSRLKHLSHASEKYFQTFQL